MAEKIGRLKSVRTAYRGHCTGTKNLAKELMESDPHELELIENRLKTLCKRLKDLSVMNQQIELVLKQEEIEKEVNDTLDYTDRITASKN